jgi:hypothetical protein
MSIGSNDGWDDVWLWLSLSVIIAAIVYVIM